MIGHPPIRFVPKTTDYNLDNSTKTFSFNLNSSPVGTVQKRELKSGDEVIEKEVSNQGQVRQTVKKLCTGDAEAYIKFHKQIDQVITGRPCDIDKDKFKIVQMMFHGDLKDTWQENSESVRISEVTKDKVDKDGNKTSLISAKGHSSTAFRMALNKLRDEFSYKFVARKEKAHTKMWLQNPRNISINQISSRLYVVNLYLSRFPAPENIAFSTGELLEIVIGMIPHSLVKAW